MKDQDPRKYGGASRGGVPARRRKSGSKRAVGSGTERFLRGLRWGVMGVLGAGAVGLLGLSLLFLYYGSDPNLPDLKKVGDYQPPQASRLLDRNGKLVGMVGGPERRRVVPFDSHPETFPPGGPGRRGSVVLRTRRPGLLGHLARDGLQRAGASAPAAGGRAVRP